ncbi:MAG: hypothetical protein EOO54_19400 [Haliea sp.]|nr:MAG: hypothetical protein EOO54_19400 [Haliea sp.]
MIMAYTKSQARLDAPPLEAVRTPESAALPYRFLSRMIEREFPCRDTGVALALCAPDGDQVSTNVILMLAYCLHQELDASVLVIDACTGELGGGVSERLGMGAQPGLKEMLRTDPTGLDQLVQPLATPGVAVLPRGRDDGEPTRALHHALPALLGQAKARHAYVLLQVSSVTSDTRSMVTATHADAVVLLAREHHTLMSTLRASEQLLRGNGAREIRAVVVAG